LSPGTPASSTTKTGRHDIAEVLLKVALNTNNQSFNPELYNNIAYFRLSILCKNKYLSILYNLQKLSIPHYKGMIFKIAGYRYQKYYLLKG
jgi:hypothetical protein